jgi:hypothetical protein
VNHYTLSSTASHKLKMKQHRLSSYFFFATIFKADHYWTHCYRHMNEKFSVLLLRLTRPIYMCSILAFDLKSSCCVNYSSKRCSIRSALDLNPSSSPWLRLCLCITYRSWHHSQPFIFQRRWSSVVTGNISSREQYKCITKVRDSLVTRLLTKHWRVDFINSCGYNFPAEWNHQMTVTSLTISQQLTSAECQICRSSKAPKWSACKA